MITVRATIILLLSLLFIQVLPGEITATYTPANSIYLQKGDEVMVLPNTPAGTFPADKYVIYLGTINIYKGSNDTYYRPRLFNYFNSNKIYVYGPHVGWSKDHSFFMVYAKNSMRNDAFEIYINNKEAILHDWSDTPITSNPFIVDLFLVSHEPTSRFDVNGTYYIPEGTLGSFNIVVNSDGAYGGQIYVPINGQTIPPDGAPPPTTTPITGGGIGAPIPGIPVGEEPEPLMFQVDIIDYCPFNLNQAFSQTGVKVATTTITVHNGQQGENYNIKIRFTNPQNSPNFTLRPPNKTYGYDIPYKLQFGNKSNIVGGELYDWENLSFGGDNSRDIYVYEVNKSKADLAPAGEFVDTIQVEIFNTN